MRLALRHLAAALLPLSFSSLAGAEGPADAAACPMQAASIYFPDGQAEPADDSKVFLNRVGEIASSCSVSRLLLVAPVTGKETSSDLELILARLGRLSDALRDSGLERGQIRMTARQGEASSSAPAPQYIEIQLIAAVLPTRASGFAAGASLSN